MRIWSTVEEDLFSLLSKIILYNRTRPRMKKLLIPFLTLILISLACSLPASWIKQTPTTSDSSPTQTPPVVLLARQSLADELGIPADHIMIAEVDSATWQDTCLELPAAGESCQPAQIDGFLIVFKTATQEYTYHTDTLDAFRRVPQAQWSQAALQSRQLLAGLLGFSPDSVEIVSEQPVKFADTCLDIHIAEIACAQILTAGTAVTLQAGENTYIFNSALDPISPVLAEVAGVSTSKSFIIWSRQGGSQKFCDDLRLYLSGWAVQYNCLGTTGMEPGVIRLAPDRQRQLLLWMLKYRPFEFRASSLDGSSVLLTFYGIGKTDPTYDEQEQISEFAASILEVPATLVPTPP